MSDATPNLTPSRGALIIACGAIAPEILAVRETLGLAGQALTLRCLPADFHNRPEKIVPALTAILDEEQGRYETIFIGYGDCGTGGALDRLITERGLTRLPGAHCYEFFSGSPDFTALMDEEPGTFFLTDYLARHFEGLVIAGLGLDRFPELMKDYFGHYTKLVYLSQRTDEELIDKARKAAKTLSLRFEHRHTGYGALKSALTALASSSAHIAAFELH